jgi:hypothetical protein
MSDDHSDSPRRYGRLEYPPRMYQGGRRCPDTHYLIGDRLVSPVEHQNQEMLASIVSHDAPHEPGDVDRVSYRFR